MKVLGKMHKQESVEMLMTVAMKKHEQQKAKDTRTDKCVSSIGWVMMDTLDTVAVEVCYKACHAC